METESKPSEMGTPLSSTLSSLSDSDSDAEGLKSAGPNNDTDSQANNEDTVEWLATTRKRRSTAGNRLKSILANEEPDSDLELLFAEDENDQGFSDAEENGSDVQMDSSDDEDENDNEDDLEGEKELEKQAKERRAAQRKRKAQEAIPAKFRKKVRIDPTTRTPAPAKPAPRPKKKSERTSWLPSAADLPTRASSRQTTRLSKEQLHQQMVEREARRIKQLAQMQKKAAKLEAMKKPPMTQEERLREAAIVEKRNSKSLNRWEEAEKQREEERRAKLAALHNRTLKGPVITFWSGIGEWMGRHMVIEEPAKEKRKRGEKAKGKEKEKATSTEDKKEDGQSRVLAANGEAPKSQEESQPSQAQSQSTTSPKPAAASDLKDAEPDIPAKPVEDTMKTTDTPSTSENSGPPPPPKTECVSPPTTMPPPPQPPLTPPSSLGAPAPPPSTFAPTPSPPRSHDPPPSGLAAPSPPPSAPGLPRPPDSKPSGVLAAPVLAPPPGIGINGTAPPMMGFGNPKSNVLAPPNTSQGSLPPVLAATAPSHNTPLPISPAPPKPSTGATPISSTTNIQPKANTPALTTKTTSPDTSAVAQAPDSQTQPPQPSTGARNAIVFQNFDDNALKDRSIQTQIIFGRKMNKLSKPSPAPLCVITNHPARYRDPRTGLPYYNAYAYREIQRLTRGEYRWSHILGAWVGSGTYAARGVPERFLHPDKKGPEKKSTSDEGAKGKDVVNPSNQAQVLETKTPDVPSGIPTTGVKMTGVEQGAPAPPNSEPNQTIQLKMAPPEVTQPLNVTNSTAVTAVAQTSAPTPGSKNQAPTNPLPTTTGNSLAPVPRSQ
ncbi:vacuolar sorting-associated protein [Fusarium beomiforme]|uniref:Vacuolar sorting-associated protein n=1 Tax=Fusarium beomiforme TaxID=44412 RepID=A0A9P5A668_9HYPO|nr:vacuolar sorting-associated protein [Fusarium beomiforme]